jgi:hypothetical protein
MGRIDTKFGRDHFGNQFFKNYELPGFNSMLNIEEVELSTVTFYFNVKFIFIISVKIGLYVHSTVATAHGSSSDATEDTREVRKRLEDARNDVTKVGRA